MPRPSRESQSIGTVTDIYGSTWRVREYRSTSHGFDVVIGWPDEPGPQGATVAMTQPLAEYLAAHDRPRDMYLPISRSTMLRLRKALQLTYNPDKWWADRHEDLHSMTLAEFAARHGCSEASASVRRQRKA